MAMTDSDHPHVDTLLGVLAHPLRRQVVVLLAWARKNRDETAVSLDVLADRLEHQANTRLRLHHVHLPKLAATGLIQWTEDDRLSPGPTFERGLELAELVQETDPASDTPDER